MKTITDQLHAAALADPRPQHVQAAAIGMPQSSYSAVMNGRDARLRTLERIAAGLGYTLTLARRRT